MPEIIRCPSCNKETYKGIARCPHCGEILDVEAEKRLQRQEEQARYGGFWIRVLATLIDVLLLYMPFVGSGFLFGFDTVFSSETGVNSSGGTVTTYSLNSIATVIYLVALWLYEATMTSSTYQATLGKLLLDLKVTDEQAKRLSFLHATGRYFAKYVSMSILNIGFLIVAFTKRKQGLHDFIASTLVVKRSASSNSNFSPGSPPAIPGP